MSLLEAPSAPGRHRYHGPEFVIPPSPEGEEFMRQQTVVESMAVRRHRIERNIAATAIASVGEGLREKWNASRRAIGNFAAGLVARFRPRGESFEDREAEVVQQAPATEDVFTFTRADLDFLDSHGITPEPKAAKPNNEQGSHLSLSEEDLKLIRALNRERATIDEVAHRF